MHYSARWDNTSRHGTWHVAVGFSGLVGTYIPGNPEKWWVFSHGHGFKRKLIFASSIFLRCKLLVSTRIRIGHKCCSDRSHRPFWGRETRWIRFGWQEYDLQILSIIDRQSEEPKCCFSSINQTDSNRIFHINNFSKYVWLVSTGLFQGSFTSASWIPKK